MIKRVLLILVLGILGSCSEDLSKIEDLGENLDIIGSWEEIGYEEGINSFTRTANLEIEGYGFTLNADGTFLERKNADRYVTTNTNYELFEGEWIAVSDSLLEVTVGFWGGVMVYRMHILSLSNDTLQIRYEYDSE